MENETTSATTRQYAPQQPANPYDAPYQSQLAQAQSAPDNRFDDQTPDTSRLYYAPMAQNYSGYPADYQQAGAKKSGALKWILITLLCVSLVSGGIIAMVIFSAIQARRATERIADRLGELERMSQEASRAESEADAPATSDHPPPPAGKTSLEQYKYPNAEVKNSVSALGNDVMTMITSDSLDEVRDHYKKQLGDPMIENEDSGSVIFHIPGSPATLITITKDRIAPDKTKITVLRTTMTLPNIN